MRFETGPLEPYKDFIDALRGALPHSSEAAKPISGSVRWDGKIAGASGGPRFQGHLRGERVRYDGVFLDYLDGDLTYAPLEFTLVRGHARRGEMETDIEANLSLTNWSFLPENNWTAEINFERVPVEGIEQLLGLSYPVKGSLTGQFHGQGTREKPTVTGLFDLADGKVYGLSFNRLRGQLNVSPDEVRIADAELRFLPPGKEKGRGAGIITGSAGYRPEDQTISADLVGAALPLENFEKLQPTRLPVGGLVSFRLKANGPVRTPLGDGTFRVVDLRIGQVIVGSFDGKLTSDGRAAHLELGSAMTTGELTGGCTLGLADPYPLSGKVSIKNINLDPFLLTALHLKEFSGHANADGDISLNGALQQPESIIVDANLSRLAMNYANVRLENAGPVHFRSTKNSLEIDPVTRRELCREPASLRCQRLLRARTDSLSGGHELAGGGFAPADGHADSRVAVRARDHRARNSHTRTGSRGHVGLRQGRHQQSGHQFAVSAQPAIRRRSPLGARCAHGMARRATPSRCESARAGDLGACHSPRTHPHPLW